MTCQDRRSFAICVSLCFSFFLSPLHPTSRKSVWRIHTALLPAFYLDDPFSFPGLHMWTSLKRPSFSHPASVRLMSVHLSYVSLKACSSGEMRWSPHPHRTVTAFTCYKPRSFSVFLAFLGFTAAVTASPPQAPLPQLTSTSVMYSVQQALISVFNEMNGLYSLPSSILRSTLKMRCEEIYPHFVHFESIPHIAS